MPFRNALGTLTAIILLASCQKGIDWNTPASTGSTTGSGNGELLVKSVSITGKDTNITLYTYDTAKRVLSMISTGSSAGFRFHNYNKYLREPSGRIYKILHFLDQPGMASDTTSQFVHYPNATTTRFDYTVHEITLGGFAASVDSSVYKYDTTGKIVTQNTYLSMPLMSSAIMSETKFEYFYNGGNLTETKTYSDVGSTGVLDLVLHYKYTYDSKPNAKLLGTEAILVGDNVAFSKNNVLSVAIIDVDTPSNSTTLNSTPVYGANNKPVSFTVVDTATRAVTKVTLFYQ